MTEETPIRNPDQYFSEEPETETYQVPRSEMYYADTYLDREEMIEQILDDRSLQQTGEQVLEK